MPGRSFRIARIASIPIGVSPLWLIIVGLITWSLGAGYYPGQLHGISRLGAYALGLGSALLLFASILAHELGHALVARRRGVEVQEIDLWLLGGMARMRGRPRSATDELSFALAGPAVTAVVALGFGAAALAVPSSAPAALRALIAYQAQVNLLILGFNLVPAFPLDGGRVARALLWRRSGDIGRATATAALLGRAFGYTLVAGGVVLWLQGTAGGLWFALIGVFLIVAAGAEGRGEQAVAMLTGIRAGELMSAPAVSIPAQVTLAEAEPYFARHRYTTFPVIDRAGRTVGLLGIDQLEHLRPAERTSALVGARAERDPALLVGVGEDVGRVLETPAFGRVGRAVVVDAERRPLGVLSITDVERAIHVRRLREPSMSAGTRA
ncbi:MAG TPA: site-2 protease family protein [Solirubrobacteraceae bacterium]|nr:site-2 protease family protein [Solirubrobacteraceae bacterium]